MRRRHGIAAAVVLGLWVANATAQPSPPAAADLLFDAPQWQAAQPGTTLVYRYARKTPLEGLFGPAFEDRIRLSLEPGAAAGARTVRVDMFSQGRHRAAGPFEDVTGNPVLVLFLEHHVETLARVLKANPRYLKNAIRAGLRDRASVTATTVPAGASSVTGWLVEAKPFTDDPNKAKMRGLDTLRYTFVASDEVPGAIASIAVTAVDPEGKELMSESLTYDPPR